MKDTKTLEYTPSTEDVTILTYIEDNEIVVDFFGVEKKSRGRGLARQEMKKFITWCETHSEELGIETIGLCSSPDDEFTDAARLSNFYLSCGFESLGSDGHGSELMEYKL